MRFLDPKGRFMGKIHLVDLLALLFLLGLSPLLFFAREAARDQPPQISDVAPHVIAPGSRIRIRGMNFRWDHEVLIGDRKAANQRYYGTDAIVAYAPPDLAPGRYPVSLKRPDGPPAQWEGFLEVEPSSGWVDKPIVVGILFRHLSPQEVKTYFQQPEPFNERISSDPKILYVWKEGSEETLVHVTGEERGKGRWVYAEVGLIAQTEPSAEFPVYYYDGQPLGDRLPVRLKLAGRVWETVADWDPEPLRLSGSGDSA